MQDHFVNAERKHGESETEYPEQENGFQEADRAAEEVIDPPERRQVNHFPDHPADGEHDQRRNDKKDDEREGQGHGRRNEGQECRRFGVVEKCREKTGDECNEAKEFADKAAPDADDNENQRDYHEQYIQRMHDGIA